MLPPRLILGVLSLGGAIGGARLLRARREARAREVERVRQALLTDPEPDPFALAWVAGLPEPARRYLAHALAPGVQLPTSVHLRLTGNLRSEPGGEWLEVDLPQAALDAFNAGGRVELRLRAEKARPQFEPSWVELDAAGADAPEVVLRH